MRTTLEKLARKFENTSESEKMIRIVFAIARCGDPAAIPLLASWMDQPGIVGRKIAEALVEMGPQVVPVVRKCLEALDEDMIRNAHRVLAAFGDEYSKRAQHAYCWADLEEDADLHDSEEEVAE
jgi:hypothetical protein